MIRAIDQIALPEQAYDEYGLPSQAGQNNSKTIDTKQDIPISMPTALSKPL